MKTIKALVTGHVQGVYFRGSCREVALRHNIDGYAQNLSNGNVEVLAQGDADAIDLLCHWLHEGPMGARVDWVKIDVIQNVSVPMGFEVR